MKINIVGLIKYAQTEQAAYLVDIHSQWLFCHCRPFILPCDMYSEHGEVCCDLNLLVKI